MTIDGVKVKKITILQDGQKYQCKKGVLTTGEIVFKNSIVLSYKISVSNSGTSAVVQTIDIKLSDSFILDDSEFIKVQLKPLFEGWSDVIVKLNKNNPTYREVNHYNQGTGVKLEMHIFNTKQQEIYSKLLADGGFLNLSDSITIDL